MLIYPLTQDDWILTCSRHHKLQVVIDRNAPVRSWYEDEIIKQAWLQRLGLGVIALRPYFDQFGR